MNKIQTLYLIIAAIIIIGIVGYSRCSLSCSQREGLSHRVPTTRVLLDNAYGKKPLPTYSENWPMVLDKREHFHDMHKCHQKCKNVQGVGQHAKCIKHCAEASLSGYSDVASCMDDRDCRSDQLCITPGAYTGTKTGVCMNENDPGVPTREKYTEQFGRSGSCRPSYFYNDNVNRCQPMFQGVSSAKYIKHHEKAGPPPTVSLPGPTRLGYGVGFTDPVDIPTRAKLITDQ